SVYGQVSISDQSIDQRSVGATGFTLVPNSYQDYLMGTEYAFWTFRVGAEYQIHDADVNPFDAYRLYARYNQRLSLDTTASLIATYANVKYSQTSETVDLYTVSAVLEHRFTQNLYGQLTVLYRDEDDSGFGRTTGWEEQAELHFEYRQTTAY